MVQIHVRTTTRNSRDKDDEAKSYTNEYLCLFLSIGKVFCALTYTLSSVERFDVRKRQTVAVLRVDNRIRLTEGMM